MNCRSAESLFSAFLEDELSQSERRSLEAHLLSCRRCSVGVRDLKATLELVHALPEVGPSPHFEEDVLARIRSGEGLRPSVLEWARGWLPSLRPVALAGAGACAVLLAVILFRPSPSPIHGPMATGPAGTETSPAAPATPENASFDVLVAQGDPAEAEPAARGPEAAPSRALTTTAPAPALAAGVASVEGEWPVSAGMQDSTLPNPGARYIDEYITDHFYIDRGHGGPGTPSVPVSGRPSDDVYIIF